MKVFFSNIICLPSCSPYLTQIQERPFYIWFYAILIFFLGGGHVHHIYAEWRSSFYLQFTVILIFFFLGFIIAVQIQGLPFTFSFLWLLFEVQKLVYIAESQCWFMEKKTCMEKTKQNMYEKNKQTCMANKLYRIGHFPLSIVLPVKEVRIIPSLTHLLIPSVQVKDVTEI